SAMINTSRARPVLAAVTALAFAVDAVPGGAAEASPASKETHAMTSEQTLSLKQQAIAPIAAAMATGDMPRLNAALHQGLEAGLAISDAKELLVQLYAYTGFPRSLNALGELMKVVGERKQRGVQDAPGH